MSAPDSTHLSAPGARLGGRYEIVALLGTGGMGAVYKAIDHELEETVALKMLRPELASDPEMLERFRREVKLARRVTHRNVARVFDIGDHGQQKFLTMELVVGESLDDRLTRQGALSPAEAVDLLLALCEGLAAAHEVGIVHRDLKPANVILHQSGRPVITDFGIAKPTGNEAIKLTQGPNMILGTPAYMAPEQVEGGPVDQRADLYALGAMAFELLTGQLPFEAKTPLSLAAARLTQSPRSLRALVPTVSTMIEQIVMRCLERDPGRRFEDARAVFVNSVVEAET